MQERLRKHNSKHKGFTGKISDWIVAYFENFESNTLAHKRELEVKKWKSRKRIEQLVGLKHSG
jgi:putative endonuclease